MDATLRILLVENNSTDQIAIQRLFRSQKLEYELVMADSLAQARDYLDAAPYDLILLDYNLGDGTGLELLESIVDTPVIFIAGSSTEEVIIKVMKAGAYDFLIKDLQMGYLSLIPSTIEKVMKRKGAEDRLNCYLAELERSNEELKNFAFVATHDLNEPLRKIIGFGKRLVDKTKDLDSDAIIYAGKMQSAAKRMQNMIDDLLQYSVASIQGEPFRLIDLNTVVREVLEDLETSISEVNGVIHLEGLPIVEADPAQMRQLFQNLISNALKFHKKEQAPKIELIAKPVRKDSLEINVKDNGIGLGEEHKENIFQPFFRLHGRSDFEGSGIGLAICKKIVTRHNGKIEVSCSNENGSTFKVTLPVKQSS
ncbi:MAG: response regulator [Nitrospina sp.]|jgi:signal transduction histidine kinase|nr:response regulator [Nitrospina sp.]MBT5631896.1 response regulator [Nitrospina sp.]